MHAPGVDVRRAADRARTTTTWLDSRHSFSFGPHYDPANTSHGLLLASNDDVVRPGGGFAMHPHRDVEIVTWVLRGTLAHRDSTGRSSVLHPGSAQRVSAGSGILHSERNDAAGHPAVDVRFVQMWVAPDGWDRAPDHQQHELEDAWLRSGLVPVVSGRRADDAALRLGNRHAALRAARLVPGQVVHLPDAPYVHLFVATGGVALEGVGLVSAGDAVRLTWTGGHRLTASTDAEVLVWEMHASA